MSPHIEGRNFWNKYKSLLPYLTFIILKAIPRSRSYPDHCLAGNQQPIRFLIPLTNQIWATKGGPVPVPVPWIFMSLGQSQQGLANGHMTFCSSQSGQRYGNRYRYRYRYGLLSMHMICSSFIWILGVDQATHLVTLNMVLFWAILPYYYINLTIIYLRTQGYHSHRHTSYNGWRHSLTFKIMKVMDFRGKALSFDMTLTSPL